MGFILKNSFQDQSGFLNLIPSVSGYTWISPEGLNWYNRVLAAGASITNANQAAFDTAFQAIYNPALGNIAPAMESSAFLMGFNDGSGGVGSAYKGCFVPIVGNPVNYNFVSSDFSIASGLTSDGLTKYIDSGALNNSSSSKHLFLYYTASPTINSPMIGSGITPNNSNCNIYPSTICFNQTTPASKSISTAPSSVGANRYSTTAFRYYSAQGTSGSVSNVGGAGGGSPNSANITIFSAGASKSISSIVFYSVGTSFSTAATELQTLSGIIETLRSSLSYSIDYLLIGGGGAAGSSVDNGNGAGGGGAGGFVSGSFPVTATGTLFSMAVGAGGTAQPPSAWGSNGGNSSISYSGSSVSAIGGGGGAGEIALYLSGLNGGSGGGAGTNGLISGSIGLGTSGQGFAGGLSDIGMNAGGGGGGAGGLGGVPYTDGSGNSLGGNGGSPITSSITGSSQYYAGGGGGAGVDVGSLDGNGLGSGIFGGGGNAISQGNVGGDGKSGGIILSIPTNKYSGNYTNATVTTNGSNTILTFTQSGTYTS